MLVIYDAIMQYFRAAHEDYTTTCEELMQEGNLIGLLYTTLDDYDLDPYHNGLFCEAYDIQVYADIENPGLVYEYTARDEYYADFTRRMEFGSLVDLAMFLYSCDWDTLYGDVCRLFDPIARKEVSENA